MSLFSTHHFGCFVYAAPGLVKAGRRTTAYRKITGFLVERRNPHNACFRRDTYRALCGCLNSLKVFDRR
jgi:hypothetical protein